MECTVPFITISQISELTTFFQFINFEYLAIKIGGFFSGVLGKKKLIWYDSSFETICKSSQVNHHGNQSNHET